MSRSRVRSSPRDLALPGAMLMGNLPPLPPQQLPHRRAPNCRRRSERRTRMCHRHSIRCLSPSTYTSRKRLTDRTGLARREHSQAPKWANSPSPGPSPGMAEHAPSQGQVVAGEGPGAEHRFSRSRTLGRGRHIWSPELQGRGTTSGVLILRNGAPYGVLSLRIPDCRFAGRRCSCGFEDLGR